MKRVLSDEARDALASACASEPLLLPGSSRVSFAFVSRDSHAEAFATGKFIRTPSFDGRSPCGAHDEFHLATAVQNNPQARPADPSEGTASSGLTKVIPERSELFTWLLTM
jgi:hypothetical protein